MANKRIEYRVAVFGLLCKGGSVLCLKRTAKTGWGDGLWSVPAGHLEPGEAPDEAVAREILEEIGVTVRAEDCRLIHAHSQLIDVPYIMMFFAVDLWQGVPTNKEPELHSDMQWLSLDEIHGLAVPELDNFATAYGNKRSGSVDYRPN